MQRVLSADLWRTLRRKARTAKCRRAAIAYVTKDLIEFREGDTLVTDASESVIRSGGTDARLLATLQRRGVALYSCPGLHAKILLLDEVAVIGSSNLSKSSCDSLIEAAIMTDSPYAVSGVASLVHQLVTRSQPLDKSALAALCKIKVVRSRGVPAKRVKRSKPITPLGSETWLVGVYELLKTTEAEEQWVEKNKEAIAQKHGAEVDSIEWIKWSKRGRFVEGARPGDRLIQICRKRLSDTKPRSVLRAVPLLDTKRFNGRTYVFLGESSGPKTEISWAAFRKMMKRLNASPGGVHSERLISPDLAEAIHRHWTKV